LIFIIIADHVVNHILVSIARGRTAFILSFTAMVLFIAWSVAFCSIVLLYPGGPDMAFAILATSIYALPVMFPFWVASIWTTVRAARKEARHSTSTVSPSQPPANA